MSSKTVKKSGDNVDKTINTDKKVKIDDTLTKTKSKSKGSGPTIEEQFKKKSLHQHILDLPDTYIGSVQNDVINMYVYDEDENRIIKKDCNIVIGLYKIFDEILVNAADNTVRDTKCNVIKINIDEKSGVISVYNNGSTIPIELHKEYNIYVPELILGNLLTSGNYDQKGKVVGGRNGIGAKACNVYSEFFEVEICDPVRKKKYYQKFINNMFDKTEPVITDISKTSDSYTKITFKPDYKRFGLKNLNKDMASLLKRRVFDLAGNTNTNVKVYLNEKYLDINSFEDYIKMFYAEDENIQIIYQDFNSRWSVGVVYDNNSGFQHMTFVNKISTFLGGTHLNMIVNQIVDGVTKTILDKHKTLKIKPSQIKDNITVFINSTIEDPSFSSQSKESLTTKSSLFNIKCDIDDKFIQKICKTGLVDELVQLASVKQLAELEKSDGKKNVNLKNLTKLDDARLAGSKRSSECRLILTEGDSAKSFAMSGLEVIGRDKYGVFPLKGKLLNVREANPKQLLGNEEIKNLKQILGLKQNQVYNDTKKLRYGGIVILTDQDSVTGDTPLLLQNKENDFEIKTIDDISSNWITKPNGKEESTNTNFKIWTDNGWTKIIKVIRHKVAKKIYRVLTHTGIVDVTEDHSLLKKDGTEVAPKDCVIDQELLHSFPKFNEHKIDIPDNLDKLSVKDLWKISQKIKIQYYQTIEKNKLIQLINNYKNSHFINLNTINKITEQEAYVMGLFFADGTCNTYKWEYKYQPVNRPNEYTYNRTSYSWSICNTNLNYLNKAIEILRNIYEYEFKIIEDRHNYNTGRGLLAHKLIINGGILTEPIISKYRKLFYDNYSKKCVPKEILNASYNVRKNFFEGYYDGDGCKASKVGAQYFDIEGKIGAHGLFFLCKSLGYEVSINTRETKTKILTLNITKGTQQHHPHTIKKIIDLGITEQYVYDLETENHHFQAGVGQMIVHNTDGYHIKGLLMNFFHYFWPSLLKIEGFVQSIATPILKVFKKSDSKKANPEIFYTLAEYKKWTDKVGDSFKNYTIKYYKGLGTSTAKEAKESFTDLEDRIVNYVWSLDSSKFNKNIKGGSKDKDKDEDDDDYIEDEDLVSNKSTKSSKNSSDKSDEDIQSVSECEFDKSEPSYQALTLAFAKQRANDRKEWVRKFDPEVAIDFDKKKITFDEFVNKDLIQFSHEDNIRSIPNISDGLKPSQRKILYGAFKRKLDNEEIKVAQLSGYISEHTGYHHGEASLQGAIINMAQDYCGSNNLNLLKPLGNFGSRRMGGKDAASARYIFTQLADLTRNIFINKDEPVLKYNVEEGDIVEPEIYYPIIPMILVNGSEGIGTGFSTNIPPHNPMEIISNIRKYLKGTDVSKLDELTPWYRGFIGKIERVNENTFNSIGNAKVISETCVHITELPIGTWTQDYIDFLSGLIQKEELIYDYENNSGNFKIDIKLFFKNNELQKLIKSNTLEKRLKIINIVKTSNMHLYKNSIITKYLSANNILKDYVEIRLEMYEKRKKHHIKVLENEMTLLKYRKKFIEQILNKKIIIERRKKTDIIQDLINLKYPELALSINSKPSYDYLTNLPLFSLTQEKIDEFNNEFNDKSQELDLYTKTSIQDLWINELDLLQVQYNKWFNSMEELKELDGRCKDKNKKINKSTKDSSKESTKTKITIQTEESKPKNKCKK